MAAIDCQKLILMQNFHIHFDKECHYIFFSQLYVLGCVELLKHVHTPWSESVEELVEELLQECLTVSHPVGVAMLEKQYSLLQLKKLLHGYGIRDFNFSDTSKGWVSKNGWMCVYDRLDLHVTYPLEKLY